MNLLKTSFNSPYAKGVAFRLSESSRGPKGKKTQNSGSQPRGFRSVEMPRLLRKVSFNLEKPSKNT